jgi:hypothetical protein
MNEVDADADADADADECSAEVLKQSTGRCPARPQEPTQ